MRPFRRLLVPHDFSEHATRALKLAADLGGDGARLTVLHVIVPFTPVADISTRGLAGYVTPSELLASARCELDVVVRRALGPRRARRADTRVVIGDPHACILRATRGMDLIVMSTAGRTGLPRLLIGSVAEKVVRHSPIPVLSLRPEVARRAARRRPRGSRTD